MKFQNKSRENYDGHSNNLTLLSLSHFATTLEVCLGSLYICKRPICDQALTSWLMSWDVASIYPHTFASSWCHLFCEVQQSLLQQSTPTTWCCHPVLHGWDGVLQLASLPLFHPNIMMVIMAKQFYFCFFRPEDISPKSTIVRSLFPCAVANCSLAVLEQWLLPCWAAFQVM